MSIAKGSLSRYDLKKSYQGNIFFLDKVMLLLWIQNGRQSQRPFWISKIHCNFVQKGDIALVIF